MTTPIAAGRATFELDEVLAATGGELVRLGATTGFPGVTPDTRGLRTGELHALALGDFTQIVQSQFDLALGDQRLAVGVA